MDLLQIESIVTTQLRVRVPRITENKYPHMSFTNEKNTEVPSFPNVYVHELEPSEVGNTIPNNQIHAIRSTIQIEVFTNVSRTEARIVANACITAMKALRYSLVVGPTPDETNNLHRCIIRMRRVIGAGDEF